MDSVAWQSARREGDEARQRTKRMMLDETRFHFAPFVVDLAHPVIRWGGRKNLP
jgi:hypothetical protein